MAILNKTPLPRGRPIIHGRETKTARAQRREIREILRALKKRLPDDHAETTEAALLPPILDQLGRLRRSAIDHHRHSTNTGQCAIGTGGQYSFGRDRLVAI